MKGSTGLNRMGGANRVPGTASKQVMPKPAAQKLRKPAKPRKTMKKAMKGAGSALGGMMY